MTIGELDTSDGTSVLLTDFLDVLGGFAACPAPVPSPELARVLAGRPRGRVVARCLRRGQS